MATTTASDEFGASLQHMWTESLQQHGVTFLRQVIDETTPLGHVVAALLHLEGEGVVLASRRLNGIWTETIPGAETSPQPQVAEPQDHKLRPQSPVKHVPTSALETSDASAASSPRTAVDSEHLKTRLVRQLVGTTAPQTGDQLTRALRLGGDIVSASEMEHLLVSLCEEGRIGRHPDKKRAWMFRPQGHQQAQGMVIKKAVGRTNAAGSLAATLRQHSLPLVANEQPGEFAVAHEHNAAVRADTMDVATWQSGVVATRPVTENPLSTVSTTMRALGKPATAIERAQSQSMLLQLAKERGLPLQRAEADAPHGVEALDVIDRRT